MNHLQPLFIPRSEKRQGTSAYYEFQYCKKDLTAEQAVIPEAWSYWAEDSLLVHMDREDELFRLYIGPYFSSPHVPDGSRVFFSAGINFYTQAEVAGILEQIRADHPDECDILIPWLRRAATEFYGLFILGI